MSRSIASEIIDKLESGEITTSNLLEFTVGDNTYRYTDCEVPITYSGIGDGEVFLSRGFEFDTINYSSGEIVDNCSVRVDNLDSVLTSIFMDNVVTEEIATIYTIVLNDDNSIVGAQQIFNGMINDFNLDEVELNMVITSIFAKWDQSSNTSHSSFCRWKEFKGLECTYSGSENTCDRSYSRCIELGNTANYGGFRWIPEIEDKEIWWGPTPTETKAWF